MIGSAKRESSNNILEPHSINQFDVQQILLVPATKKSADLLDCLHEPAVSCVLQPPSRYHYYFETDWRTPEATPWHLTFEVK